MMKHHAKALALGLLMTGCAIWSCSSDTHLPSAAATDPPSRIERHYGNHGPGSQDASAALDENPVISDFALYAQRSVVLGDRALVNGDIGVAFPAPSAFGPQVVVSQLSRVAPDADILAPSVLLGKDADVGDIETGQLTNNGGHFRLQASQPSPMPPPPIPLPATPGSSNISVSEWEVRKLVPNAYGALTVAGTVLLEPGQYSFVSVTMRDRARILALPGAVAADVRIAGNLGAGRETSLAPLQPTDGWADSWGADPHCSHEQPAAQLSISVDGYDGASGTPTAFAIGDHSLIQALIRAPHGTLVAGTDVAIRGALSAFDIRLGNGSTATFESGFPAATVAGQSQGTQLLSGYVTPTIAAAPVIGPVPESATLDLELGLSLPDPAGLASFIQSVSDPKSAYYRQYVTGPADFGNRFGSASDYANLQQFAAAAGLTVVETFPNNMLLHVTGTTAVVEAAFFTTLTLRSRPDGTLFYAPAVEPSLNSAVPILRISGLDSYAASYSGAGVGGSGTGANAGMLQGSDLRNAYLGASSPLSNLTGAAVNGGEPQHVALFELNGFNIADLNAYITLANITTPMIVNYNQVEYYPGFPQDLTTQLCVGQEPNGTQEAAGDVEMIAAVAPAATVDFYFGSNCGGTSLSNLILSYMATTTPLANQASTSWFTGADDNTTNIAAEMAAQGQSLFVLSGDNGAYLGGTTALDVRMATSQWATIVGGTTLTMAGSGGTYVSETTWNGGLASASGGGILDFVVVPVGPPPGLALSAPLPWWQTCPNNNSGCSTQFRNAPDVSAVANNLVVCWGAWLSQPETCSARGGTSYSTPIWAAFTALINQQAEINNLPPVGFLNPALYEIYNSPSYGNAFNDIADGSNNNGYTAVTGYDLATGLGTPQWGLIYDLVGGSTPPPEPDSGSLIQGSQLVVSISAASQYGKDVCITAPSQSGATPGDVITPTYLGIPGYTVPVQTGTIAVVQPDESFSLQDLEVGNVIDCTQTQMNEIVTIELTEKDSSNAVITSTSVQVPGWYWCANHHWPPSTCP